MPEGSRWTVQGSGDCKGVQIASGQVLHSEKVVASPTFCVEHPATSESTPTTSSSDVDAEESAHLRSSDVPSTSSGGHESGGDSTKVARCLCITDQSLQPGLSTVLVIFPPNCESSYCCALMAIASLISSTFMTTLKCWCPCKPCWPT